METVVSRKITRTQMSIHVMSFCFIVIVGVGTSTAISYTYSAVVAVSHAWKVKFLCIHVQYVAILMTLNIN